MKMVTNIKDLDMDGKYSYADYLTWQFKERLELIKGKIFKMSPAPSWGHQRISSNLHGYFWTMLKGSSCNLFAAPFDVKFKKKGKKNESITTVVQPDLGIVCDATKLDEQGCNGAPDLIVEILSPGNTKKEMSIKFDLYEENGVLEYWIVQPETKNVFIYTLQNGKYIGHKPLTETDKIKSPLFPKLKINLKDVFS